jgi:quinol monooxygenase YgiN
MTMSKASVMGTFTCQDGKADEMEAVLAEMVEAARSEPGVEIYSYHRGDDNTFWFFALMADAESMQSHGQSEAMQAAMQDFGPLMAEPPEMSVTKPVAAIGLDL